MTKGHYHQQLATAEIYLCLRGEGLMLMKTQDDQCRGSPLKRGRMVYVPPCWAHRSINTGDEPLISFCVYPAHAGHNYGDIQSSGFPRRVFKNRARSSSSRWPCSTRFNLAAQCGGRAASKLLILRCIGIATLPRGRSCGVS